MWGRARGVAGSVWLLTVLGTLVVGYGVASAVGTSPVSLPAIPGSESEPNDSLPTASTITSGQRVRANIKFAGDVDFYKFDAHAGDRVYAATITSGSADSNDSELVLLDGASTAIETDQDNGSQANGSSSIAGASIPADGTYYLKVRDASTAVTERYYDLYLQLRSGNGTPESEPNDDTATADSLASGLVSGARNPASGTEQDFYSLDLNAGDTVFLSLDLDPERDGTVWNGKLGFCCVGDSLTAISAVDDAGAAEAPTTIPSEAYVATVSKTGTYYVDVNAASAAVGGPTATYRLSATVIPAEHPDCRTYSAGSLPAAIGPNAGSISVPIVVGDPARVDRIALDLDLTHTAVVDLDVSLQAPDGNEVVLFTDQGGTRLESVVEQNAALPFASFSRPFMLQPELDQRLNWFEGQKTAGTWNLIVRDDANSNGGTLSRADLILCPQPEETATDPIFSANFEGGDNGFTHSGTSDEWERGTPATPAAAGPPPRAALTTCAQGTSCWKTDLDDSYNNGSNQDLLSPPIPLTGRTGKILATWEQWYQLENPNFDRLRVSVEEDGGANSRTLFDWNDGNQAALGVGNPVVDVPTPAGWGRHRADISDYAGKTIRLRFHLQSDSSIVFTGVGIDDVQVYQPKHALTVAKTGAGAGFVDSAPAGIDCGDGHGTCSSDYTDGTSVTLTAHPSGSSTFSGFSGGGCSGSGSTCVVDMTQARSVTATFANPSQPDTEAPDTTKGKGPKKQIEKKTAIFRFTSPDPTASFVCRLDKAREYTPCASPARVAKLKDGKHKFRARAIDPAGNLDPSEVVWKFEVELD